MSSATLYGIKNCDTVKKARKWLDANSVPYTFHDFRVDGIDKTLINNFLKQLDLESLINKRGTTWRKLSAQEKEIKNKTPDRSVNASRTRQSLNDPCWMLIKR